MSESELAKRRKRLVIMLSGLFVSIMGIYIYVQMTTCAASGCIEERYPKSDLCWYHLGQNLAYHLVYYPNRPYSEAEQLFMEEYPNFAKPKCLLIDCNEIREEQLFYCEKHTCHNERCTINVMEDGEYCEKHTCSRSYKGCRNGVETKGDICFQCKAELNSDSKKNSSSYSKPSGSTHSSGSKKELPDVDDYEDFDDFMDDWDGNMPDGLDAEDYWEDW